jgi:putative hydrolase of the HAD superfamily
MSIDKNKIKAVIFDWGGVCCKEGEPFASLELQKVLGKNPDEIAGEVKDIYSGYYVGKYNRDTFWNAIIKHFNLDRTDAINPEALSDAYLNSYKIYQEVLDIALKLQNKYKVALLSNLTPEMRDNIKKRHETSRYFPIEIYSCDTSVNSTKPCVKPYQIAVDRLQVSPTECLFIDNSQKNLDAASGMGMNTMLFESLEKFLSEINFLD